MMLVISSIAIASLTINFILSVSLNFVWGMINTLQLAVHLPLFSVLLPASTVTFYSTLMGVANFNVVPVSDIIEDTLPFNEEEQPHTVNFMMMGYERENSILNLGMVFILLVLGLIVIAAVKLLDSLNMFKHCKKIKAFLEKNFLYSFLIRLFIEGYLELSICAFVNFKTLNFEYGGNAIASVFSISLIIGVMLFPSVTTVFLIKEMHSLEELDFKKKYGSLYDGLKTNCKGGVLYYCVFSLRRLLFAWMSVFLTESPLY